MKALRTFQFFHLSLAHMLLFMTIAKDKEHEGSKSRSQKLPTNVLHSTKSIKFVLPII